MAQTIDTTALMLTFLAADAALLTAVSNRLDGPPTGIPEGATEGVAALRVVGAGGPGSPDVPVTRERFEFHAYGPTQEGAMAVYRALNDTLQRAQGRTVTVGGARWRLIFAERESGPTPLPEPEMLWPRVVSAYRVTMCEWAIS